MNKRMLIAIFVTMPLIILLIGIWWFYPEITPGRLQVTRFYLEPNSENYKFFLLQKLSSGKRKYSDKELSLIDYAITGKIINKDKCFVMSTKHFVAMTHPYEVLNYVLDSSGDFTQPPIRYGLYDGDIVLLEKGWDGRLNITFLYTKYTP